MRYASQASLFPFISQPIEPFFSAQFSFLQNLDFRGFHKKGESLGGFVFPQNEFVHSNAQLFSKYRLYVNSNGVNLPGTLVRPLEELNHFSNFLSTTAPVFAGDFLETGERIQAASGVFDPDLEVWSIACVFGDPPKPLGAPPENLFFSQLVSSFEELKSSIDLLVSAVTSPNGPVTFPNQSVFDQQLETIKKQLEELKL